MSDLTAALWRRYRDHGDPRARVELLDGYLGLVHHAAREIVRSGTRALDLDELVSAGTVGLVQAFESFDETRGRAFSTYALPRIRGAMLDELRREEKRSRLSRERGRRIARTRTALEHDLGRRADPAEIARSLGVDLDTYWRLADAATAPRVIALDEIVETSAGPQPVHETLADSRVPPPDQALLDAEARGGLRAAFAELPDKDRLVLTLYFYERLTMRQIGEVLHVSESRVSQIRTLALRRLRERLNTEENR